MRNLDRLPVQNIASPIARLPHLRKLNVHDWILFPILVIVVPPFRFVDGKPFRHHRRTQQFAQGRLSNLLDYSNLERLSR